LERFQSDVSGIYGRLAAIVDPLVTRLDEVRRGARDPADLGPELAAARTSLRGLGTEARAAKPPGPLADRAEQLVLEVDRAVRAADMAAHGLGTMGVGRRATSPESDVELKRGALGLRHAREAVTRIMMGVAKLQPADVRAMPVSTTRAPAGAYPPLPPEDELLSGVEEPPAP
ncbi:MAG TPA: hypothetical protein VIH37_02800, partial [Candidatus Limnocylindrales bacterium]